MLNLKLPLGPGHACRASHGGPHVRPELTRSGSKLVHSMQHSVSFASIFGAVQAVHEPSGMLDAAMTQQHVSELMHSMNQPQGHTWASRERAGRRKLRLAGLALRWCTVCRASSRLRRNSWASHCLASPQAGSTAAACSRNLRMVGFFKVAGMRAQHPAQDTGAHTE